MASDVGLLQVRSPKEARSHGCATVWTQLEFTRQQESFMNFQRSFGHVYSILRRCARRDDALPFPSMPSLRVRGRTSAERGEARNNHSLIGRLRRGRASRLMQWKLVRTDFCMSQLCIFPPTIDMRDVFGIGPSFVGSLKMNQAFTFCPQVFL